MRALATPMGIYNIAGRMLGGDSLPYWQQVKYLFGGNLIGYWPLDEASGTVARDISGNGRDGTYAGSIVMAGETNAITGKQSPTWSGVSGQFVNLNAYANLLSINVGTIILLVRPAAGVLSGTTSRCIAMLKDSVNSYYNNLSHRPTSYLNIFNKFGYGGSPWIETGFLKENTWSLVVATWSVADGIASLYINNNLVATVADTTSLPGTLNTLLIGASGGTDNWIGSISDVVAVNRLITPAEAQQVFSAFLSSTNFNASIIGDSISAYSAGWQTHVFGTYRSNRTKIKNHAVGGQSIMPLHTNDLAVQVAAAAIDDADLIILAMGANDDNAGNMAALQATVETNIASLKASNPRATLYYLNVLPVWTDASGATPKDKANIRAAIAAACAAQGVTCWDSFTSPWITAADTSDGVHPTAAGAQKIATQVLARL